MITIHDTLTLRARAYKQLLAGSSALLEQDRLVWTERLLLKLVRTLYTHRLDQLLALLPDVLGADVLGADVLADEEIDQAQAQLKANILEAQVTAALGGHQLLPWQPVPPAEPTGHQAACRYCEMSVYVSAKTYYTLLADQCPGQPAT
jgi:hypothetical protein